MRKERFSMVGAQSIWAFYLSRRALGTLREKKQCEKCQQEDIPKKQSSFPLSEDLLTRINRKRNVTIAA